MKKEYDFSQAERGNFYKKDSDLNLPIYLDKEVLSFVLEIARKQNADLSTIVNQLIRDDMRIANTIM